MKKTIQKIILFLLIFIFLIFVLGFLFVAINGKSFFRQQLAKALKTPVDVASVRFRPIFTLEIKGLQISGLGQVERLVVSPIVTGFSKEGVVLGTVSLFNPQFSIVKSADGSWALPQGLLEKLQGKGEARPQFMPSGLLISGGNAVFKDLTKTPTFGFSVKNISVDIGNRLLSLNPILTRFKISANIVTQEGLPTSALDAGGWINFLRKDMKGQVELSNVDAVYFLPLYGKFMTSSLKNGILSFKSDLVAKKNDLLANCHLAIKNLAFEKNTDGTAPAISFFDIVAGGLQTENKEVNIDFIIRTKLDKPRVDLVKLSGSIVAKALGEQMIKSPEKTLENFKSVGKEFEKLGKDILKNQLGIDLNKKKEEEAVAPAPSPSPEPSPSPTPAPEEATNSSNP